MDTSYCLKSKRKTKNINSKGFVTENKKYLVNQHVLFVSLKNQNLFQKRCFWLLIKSIQ